VLARLKARKPINAKRRYKVAISAAPIDRTSNAKGIAWAVAAVGLFALIYLSGKLTGGVAAASQIIWLRYVGGFTTVLLLICISRVSWQDLATGQLYVHVFRAASGGGGGMAAIYAAANMPVAEAAAIGLLDGFFTVILGVIILKEVVSHGQWAAGSVCLVGATVVAVGNGATLHLDPAMYTPSLIALAGAFLVAIESILIKTLARSENALIVLFYVNLLGILLFAAPTALQWQPISSLYIAVFLCLGPISIIAQTCNIRAFRLADAALIGPVRYTWMIFGACFGLLFFGEMPRVSTFLGGALIILGGLGLAVSRSPYSVRNNAVRAKRT
jgi:drug/metabolite transporter (DMT)-like permease